MMNDEQPFGEPVYVYTNAKAVEDGVLLQLAHYRKHVPVFVTRNCFDQLRLNDFRRASYFCTDGLERLDQPDPEDDENRRMREFKVQGTRVWVIADGNGITFMLPEDY